DLLPAIGIPNKNNPNIQYATGTQGYPSFELKAGADIRRTAQTFFKRPLFKDFAIRTTVRFDQRSGGFLFAVVNPFQTIITFGLSVTSHSDSQRQTVKLYYTPNTKFQEVPLVIAEFTIDSIAGKWTKLGVRVEGDEITLFVNCKEYQSLEYRRRVEQLDFEPGSTLFIGKAGP
ncbi:hypothetical protein LOTGIDRAFT_97644, partial [Lottia gigantea]